MDTSDDPSIPRPAGGLPLRGVRPRPRREPSDLPVLARRARLRRGRDLPRPRRRRPGPWDDPAVDAAARWVFLLAGVSYYKTAAPARGRAADHAAASGRARLPPRRVPRRPRRVRLPQRPRPLRPAHRGPDIVDDGPGVGARVRTDPDRRQAAARPLRRGHRLDRDGRARAPAGRRRAVRRVPARRPVRRHRASRRGDRPACRAGRAGHRRAGAALGRARVPQRPRARHRHHLGHRRARRGARRSRRARDVERVVVVGRQPRRRRAHRQPPVVEEPGLRDRLPWRARALARHRGRLLLPAAAVHRAVHRRAVRRARRLPPHLPELQPRLPHRPGPPPRPLVRPVRQVRVHRPDPRPVPRRRPAGRRCSPAPSRSPTRRCSPASRPWSTRRAPSSRGSASARSTSAAPPWPWPPPAPTGRDPRCSAPSSTSSATACPSPDAIEALRHPVGEHYIPDAYASSDLLV